MRAFGKQKAGESWQLVRSRGVGEERHPLLVKQGGRPPSSFYREKAPQSRLRITQNKGEFKKV